MRLQAEINGETVEVDISRDGDKLSATVGDREYSLEISEPETGVLLLRQDGQIFEAFISQPSTPDSPTSVTIRGLEYQVSITDPKRLHGARGGHSHDRGTVEIKTAMPGKVVRLLALAGDEVKKGDGVIVVEAMKMQNEMKSPKAGRVVEVKTKPDATVAAGEVLVVIE